jgi:hypothetical protein
MLIARMPYVVGQAKFFETECNRPKQGFSTWAARHPLFANCFNSVDENSFESLATAESPPSNLI